MESDCIFCTQAKENPRIVFEDKTCYVIPSLFPSDYGHLLVISKEHTENTLTAQDKIVAEMFVVAKKMGLLAREKLGANAMAIATNVGKGAGQVIFHFHIHVVPKYDRPVEGFIEHKELDSNEAALLLGKLKS